MSRTRSVLIVTPWFPNKPGDRQGNYVYSSAAALAQAGISVGVLVTRPFVPRMLEHFRRPWLRDRFDPTAFPQFAHVERVLYPYIPGNWLWSLGQSWHDRKVDPELHAMAHRLEPDLIHAHTEGEAATAVRAAKHLGIPAVVTLHGINTGPRYFGDPARRQYFASALRAADRVVLVGEPLRMFFRDLVGSDDNFRTVPNGVDFPARPPRPRFLNQSGTIRFISVSNLDEGKGIDIALESLAAARRLGFEDWDYAIVGDGSEKRSLTAMANTLSLMDKVRFYGACPHSKVFDLLDTADVFVLPSYREAFGIAYLEAMACGLLAIGVQGEGPSAFIEDGKSGFLVPPRDSGALTERLLAIASNRSEMRKIASAGAAHVRNNYTWQSHSRALLALYRELGVA